MARISYPPAGHTSSKHLHKLRRAAARIGRELMAQGARAVAITGSVGRGNPGPGSDIDLWVIGARNKVTDVQRGAYAITLIEETLTHALTFEQLCLTDVGDMRVLHDPQGVLARIAARRQKLDAKVRTHIVDATLEDLAMYWRATGHGSPAARRWALYQATVSTVGLEVYLQKNIRLPKTRDLLSVVPARERQRARRLFGVAHARRERRFLQRALARFESDLRRGFAAQGLTLEPIRPPLNILAKLAAGACEEALMQARHYFHQQCVERCQKLVEPQHLEAFIATELPTELGLLWRCLLALDEPAPRCRELRTLARSLSIAPRVERLLATQLP